MTLRGPGNHGLRPRLWTPFLAVGFAALVATAALTACGAAGESNEAAQAGGEQAAGPRAKAANETGPMEITTYAGTGSPKFKGDAGPAIEAGLFAPKGVALDSEGDLYISTDNRIRRIEFASGIITTIAGTGTNRSGGDGGPATEAGLAEPKGLAVDNAGNVFVTARVSGRIRHVDAATGIITTVAGGGIGNPLKKIFGDGGPATEAFLKLPEDVALDDQGNFYIATDNRIRKVDAATGIITTVAGTGFRGLEGDGGPATSAGMALPMGVKVDDQGNIFIADSENHRVRKVDGATGIMTTVAGIGKHYKAESATGGQIGVIVAPATGAGYSGDGGLATEAMLSLPTGLALGPKGDLFIADGKIRIRKVDFATGLISTIASSEAVGAYATGKIQILTGTFGELVAIAVNDKDEAFLADYKNNVVHKVSAPAAP